MQNDYSLLAPGPVNLHPMVQHALSLPMIHHRTPQFDEILKRVLSRLKTIFATNENVYIQSSTGSGGMESLLVNTLSPGDEVLCIDSGKFGERWAEMAKVFGMKVHVIKTTWGQSVDPQDVAAALQNNPNIRAVLCQATETSTAVANPIQKLGEIIHQCPQTLFLVDGITATAAYLLPFNEWHIDGLVAGSQKAFMLPTGLSFVCFSPKAQARFSEAKCARYYFDIRREQKANTNGETFFSSSVALVRALDVVLELIFEKGLPKHYAEIESRARMAQHFGPHLGLPLFSQAPSLSVTAFSMPSHIDGQKLRQHLEDKHNITIMGGQDQAKGKIIRLGHMGYIQPHEMERFFVALLESLRHFDPEWKKDLSVSTLKSELKAWAQNWSGE